MPISKKRKKTALSQVHDKQVAQESVNFDSPRWLAPLMVAGRKRNLDISQITTLVVINVVIGFVLSGIDWRAHLGGLAAGALITWFLLNATSLKEKNQR